MLVWVRFPSWDALAASALPVMLSEAFAHHRRSLQDRWAYFTRATHMRVASACFYSGADVVQARRAGHRVRAEVDRALHHLGVLAHPTVGASAPPVDGLDVDTAGSAARVTRT